MAVSMNPKKTAVSLKLNNGTDSEGKIKTVNLNLGTLKIADFTSETAQKAQNIITALKPCLSKAVVSVEKTHIDFLVEGV